MINERGCNSEGFGQFWRQGAGDSACYCALNSQLRAPSSCQKPELRASTGIHYLGKLRLAGGQQRTRVRTVNFMCYCNQITDRSNLRREGFTQVQFKDRVLHGREGTAAEM